jgi:hypothetical protein
MGSHHDGARCVGTGTAAAAAPAEGLFRDAAGEGPEPPSTGVGGVELLRNPSTRGAKIEAMGFASAQPLPRKRCPTGRRPARAAACPCP